MKKINIKEAYRMTDALLKEIKKGSLDKLNTFGVTPAIYKEITEELKRSGEVIADLTLPPYEIALVPDRTNRIPFDIYETNAEPNSMKISSQLWANGKETDLTMTADYYESEGRPSLLFTLLETQ